MFCVIKSAFLPCTMYWHFCEELKDNDCHVDVRNIIVHDISDCHVDVRNIIARDISDCHVDVRNIIACEISDFNSNLKSPVTDWQPVNFVPSQKVIEKVMTT